MRSPVIGGVAKRPRGSASFSKQNARRKPAKVGKARRHRCSYAASISQTKRAGGLKPPALLNLTPRSLSFVRRGGDCVEALTLAGLASAFAPVAGIASAVIPTRAAGAVSFALGAAATRAGIADCAGFAASGQRAGAVAAICRA